MRLTVVWLIVVCLAGLTVPRTASAGTPGIAFQGFYADGTETSAIVARLTNTDEHV